MSDSEREKAYYEQYYQNENRAYAYHRAIAIEDFWRNRAYQIEFNKCIGTGAGIGPVEF